MSQRPWPRADRIVGPERDLIFGISANSKPSLSDRWNTAAAWMQSVPVPSSRSSRFIDGSAPYPGYGAGGHIAGLTAYAFWNRTLYAELGGYTSARGLASFMSAGVAAADTTRLRGINPCWRLACSREWGAHNLMLGTAVMLAQVYDDPLDTGDPATTHRCTDLSVDAQYQYLLDPHAVTAQFVYTSNRHRCPTAGNARPAPDTHLSDTTHVLRMKPGCVYQAGCTGSPATSGMTVEGFWSPIQVLRLGAQFTAARASTARRTNTTASGAMPATTTRSSSTRGWPTDAAHRPAHRPTNRAGEVHETCRPRPAGRGPGAGCSHPDRSRNLADPTVTATTLAQQVCSNCHGRHDPAGFETMWGPSRSLSDAQIDGLAACYAAQVRRLHAPEGDRSRLDAGRSVFESGVPAAGVPARSGCHGALGLGMAGFVQALPGRPATRP